MVFRSIFDNLVCLHFSDSLEPVICFDVMINHRVWRIEGLRKTFISAKKVENAAKFAPDQKFSGDQA